jgi:glycosyltransferase involved in cell wall biosynthesis
MGAKITIITVVFNAQKVLERTIKSVLEQTYPFIEYIIIDGASTDGTLSILEKYETKFQNLISEKDNGIYDAMNKGLNLATGDYILFLNAGDELYDKNILEKIFSKTPHADVYYGNTKVVNIKSHELGDRRLSPPEQLTWESFKYGMLVSHQSFIAKRNLCGMYDLNYRIAADIDWVINILKKSSKIVNTKLYISKFLEGGKSSQAPYKALKERFLIMANHYGLLTTIVCHIYIVFRFMLQKLSGN